MAEVNSIPNFEFTESAVFDKTSITRRDLLPDSQCFVLYNVLTPDECSQLISHGESFGFIDLKDSYTQTYRTNERIVNHNPHFRKTLWDRIESHVDTHIEMNGKHETLQSTFFTDGVWKKDHLNEQFRLCKYNPTNFFKRHTDEGYHPSPKDHRSFKTCMAYLNSEFEGGETVFYFSDGTEFSLKPEVGMCLIFNQNILHEGATVTSGLKYFIRTDIQYKKISVTKNTTLTPAQLSALELYDQAVQLDNEKRNDEAIVFYKRAMKTCDDIEMLYYSMYGYEYK
jgi:hypothetical protein